MHGKFINLKERANKICQEEWPDELLHEQRLSQAEGKFGGGVGKGYRIERNENYGNL